MNLLVEIYEFLLETAKDVHRWLSTGWENIEDNKAFN
jgi:hypothetical protein